MPRSALESAEILAQTRAIDEFVVRAERRRFEERVFGANAQARAGDASSLEASLYRDVRRGRGSARVRAAGLDPEELARQASVAAALAASSAGPAWVLPPPSAPARVDVADPDIAGDPDAAASRVARELAAALGPRAASAAIAGTPLEAARARVVAARADVEVATSAGFASGYTATEIALEVDLRGDRGPVQRLALRARRASDLPVAEAVAAAAARIRDRARASSTDRGRYDLLFGPDAIAPPGGADPYGLLAPLVAQADAETARRGLTRYRPGDPIAAGGSPRGDALTVESDGTRDFGLASAPFGELGEPVRRFALVRDGAAADLSLDLREAALRERPPNGGVRNLVVAAGPRPLEALRRPERARPVLEIAELAWRGADPRTGEVTAEIALAYLHGRGAAPAPVAGGLIALDAFAALSRARLSAETTTRGRYTGPSGILVPDVPVR